MTFLNRRTAKRQGFTLVELLVVIVIIGIIVSLVSVAVVMALRKGSQLQVTNELRQFATGVENFKARFNVYPPSRIILCENVSNYYNPGTGQPWTQLHADSLAVLGRMFPRINWASSNVTSAGTWVGIDWNGNNSGPDPPVVLEGDQCLVFFLGGIPISTGGVPTCSGFSTNPNNPAFHTNPLNTGDVIAPFAEFQTSRLTIIPRTTYVFNPALGVAPPPPVVSPFHYTYLDPYGKMPYAFFSSAGQRNAYNKYYGILLTGSGSISSDCTTLSVWPYAEKQLTTSTLQYLNPSSFQVISAGGDAAFGRGTDLTLVPQLPGQPSPYWTIATIGNQAASTVSWDYSSPTPNMAAGFDDQSNFSAAQLGVAPQ